MAQQQLREKASEDLNRHGADRGLSGNGVIAIMQTTCGILPPISANPLETLTDEQVGMLWAHVDENSLATLQVLDSQPI